MKKQVTNVEITAIILESRCLELCNDMLTLQKHTSVTQISSTVHLVSRNPVVTKFLHSVSM